MSREVVPDVGDLVHVRGTVGDEARRTWAPAESLVETPGPVILDKGPETGGAVTALGERAQQPLQQHPADAAALEAFEQINGRDFAAGAEIRAARIPCRAEADEF